MGRQKEFDEQDVLDKAMHCFWKNGYDNTTVRQLEHEMGINQFSIYSSFKSKKDLYKKVLLNYATRWNQRFLTDLREVDATIHDVEEMLLDFSLSMKYKEIPNSCLMVISATQLNRFDHEIQDIVIRFFEGMKSLFKQALQNSIRKQLLPKSIDLNQASEYLVGIAQSISVYSKIQSAAEEIESYVHYAIAKI